MIEQVNYETHLAFTETRIDGKKQNHSAPALRKNNKYDIPTLRLNISNKDIYYEKQPQNKQTKNDDFSLNIVCPIDIQEFCH